MAEAGGGKKGGLETLSKEELLGKCKTLLQIAQKAKKAKDDVLKEKDDMQEEHKKEKELVLKQLKEIESKQEECEDILKAKQRQLDRLGEENDSLLEQMDTYCVQLKVVTKEKAEAEKRYDTVKEKCNKLEKQAFNCMELEANMICLKEREKTLEKDLQMIQDELANEKILSKEKNGQLQTLYTELKKVSEGPIAENETNKDSKIGDLKKEIQSLNTELEKCKEAKSRVDATLIDTQSKLRSMEDCITVSKTEIQTVHETSFQQLEAIEELKAKLTLLENENTMLTNNCEELKTNCCEKEKILNLKDVELSELLSSKISTEKTNLEQEQKNAGLIDELNQLNEEMKKRGERLEKIEKVNTDQLNKIRALEKNKEEKQSNLDEIGDLRSQLENVKERLACTILERENNATDLAQKVKDCSALSNAKDALQQEADKIWKENETLTQNIDQLKIEMTTLRKTHFDDKNKLTDEANKSKQLLEVSQSKLLTVENERKMLEEKLDNSNEICQENQKLSNSLKEKQEKIKELKSQLDDKRKIINESKKALQEKVKELSAITSITLAKDSEERSQHDHIESKLKETLHENLELKEKLKMADSKLEDESIKVKKLEIELKVSQDQQKVSKEKKEDAITELQTRHETVTQKLEELLKENERLSNYSTKFQELDSRHKSVVNEFMEMKKLYETCQQKLTEENGKNSSLVKQINDVEKEKMILNDEIEKLQSNLSETTKKFSELKEVSLKSQSLNSTLHEHDESRSEIMSTSTVSKAEEFNRMKDVEDSFEDRYSKLKLIAIKLKKKVGEQEKIIKELSSKKSKSNSDEGDSNHIKEKLSTLTINFNNLQKEYDVVVDKLENVEADNKILKKDLAASMADSLASKQKSEESIQQALAAKTELTKMEEITRDAAGKIRSLEITLEEERKERKLLETNAKISDDKASQLKDMTAEKILIEETLQSLKLQVVQLEETLSKERERADTLNKALSSTRAQLTQTESDLSRQRIEMAELNKKHEDTVRATEALQEQVGDVIKNSEKEQGLGKNKVLQLERQVSALETNLQSKAESLTLKEKEFQKVSKEFEQYKLRAQSVLKQSKDKALEEESTKKKEDILALEKMNDALNEKLKSMSLEMRTISLERVGLQDEHDRLMERHSLLLQELATKEKNWREKAEQQNTKMREIEDDKTGNLERVQKTMENLKQIHQQEIERIKASSLTEITKMKQLIDSKENEVIRLELVVQKEQETRRQIEEANGHIGGATIGYENRLDITQIEREACEGQEVDTSSGPSPNSSLASPLPLEQLLAQSNLPEATHEEPRSNTSSRVGGADRQVSHLAALLSESEAQNSRLEKLTEVLKEEIRTYQRSEERHKHIENLEYVKNVILKFLTLTGAQERARLIPVLKTILKLKKEEVDKIEELIRVDGESQSASESWGSYLHLWSTTP